MWSVELPAKGNINAQLDSALVQKDGTIDYALSPAERAEIAAVYDAYDALRGEPDATLNPATLNGCRDAIHKAYSQLQKGGRLADLRGELLAAVLECPLCGADAATTLDHHLPREYYRALSLYSRNLVPSCQPCNRAKGTLAPVAGQGMIHAYFQALPATTFLVADVEYDDGKLLVSFRIDDTFLPAGLGERLTFQLGRLKLDERYFGPINIFLFGLKPSLLMFRGSDNEAELIKAFLLSAATTYDGDFKLNHWKSALVRGLAVSDSFLINPWPYFDRPLVKIKPS